MNSNPQLLFILGFPRSGTKLLMQLLKSHPEVSGADYEINLAHHVALGNINSVTDLEKYFFDNTISLNYELVDKQIKFFENYQDDKISEVYKDFLGTFNSLDNPKYLLDKSPRYLPHIERFLETYPDARFIHLIRNPIDVALSHKKVWNKSIIRTSSQWNMSNSIFIDNDDHRIMRIKYEELTTSPADLLDGISRFLDIENVFDIQNVNSKERHGNVIESGIKNNSNNYQVKKHIVELVETYAYRAMKAFNYEIKYAKKEKKRNIILKVILLLWDHINLIMFHINEKGIRKGLKYYSKLL